MIWRTLAASLCLAACQAAGEADRPAASPDLGIILAEDPAPVLSAYGLFGDVAATTPASGVVPYDLINPLFSDHAEKHRLLFVPPGEVAQYDHDGVMRFPVGTVLVKTFAFAPDMRDPQADAYRVETRLLIHKASGWAAYPYIWNDTGTEAAYAPVGGRKRIETISPSGVPLAIDYAVPNQNQCKTCHQSAEGISPIGPTARGLNHEDPAGMNQLADWTRRGLLSGVPAVAPAAAAIHDVSLPLADRARAYLDINCGHCHKPDGSASNSGLFLDAGDRTPVQLGIGKHPVAAGRGAGQGLVAIAPGDPDASILAFRMASAEPGIAMPELGRSVVDEEGVALVRAWIASLEAAK